MKVRASAPGKLVVLGEYAVLFGAPALVMAANRRAHVEFSPQSDADALCISAPDVHAEPVRCSYSADGDLQWPSAAAAASATALHLVTGLLCGLLRSGWIEAAALRGTLHLDTSAFFWTDTAGRRDKLGLGSSAALTVALAAAVLAATGLRLDRLDAAGRSLWLQRLLQLHRDFQGGRGSGLDVAASLYGGCIDYRLQADATAQAQPRVWPAGLQRIAVWSGQSASTARFLEALETWRRAEPQISAELFARLHAAAERGAVAAAAGDAEALRQAAAAYTPILQSLGELSNIRVFTPEHRQIRELAEGCGAVYKPCGAGGGDLGLALAGTPETASAVRRTLTGAGFGIVDLDEDPEGLKIDFLLEDR